jgi:hypothetical protein
MRWRALPGASQFVLALTALFMCVTAGETQTGQCETEVPAVALDSFKRGQAAAGLQRPAWDIAIKYFYDSLSDAPDNLALICRLAVAHQAADHWVPAVVYWREYLSVGQEGAPRGIPKEQVDDKIRLLEVSIEQRANLLFRSAVDILDQLPDSDKAKTAQSIAVEMLYGLREEEALSLAMRYPTGMTEALAAAAMARKLEKQKVAGWGVADPPVVSMFNVAEQTAMFDPADVDLKDMVDQPGSPPLVAGRSVEEVKAKQEQWMLKQLAHVRERREQFFSKWRYACQATRLYWLGIAEGLTGLVVQGYRTHLRGARMMQEVYDHDGWDGDLQTNFHPQCLYGFQSDLPDKWSANIHFVHSPDADNPNHNHLITFYHFPSDVESRLDTHGRQYASVSLSRGVREDLFPFDLIRDRVFAAFGDVIAEIKARRDRGDTAGAAIAAAQVGRELAVALLIFHNKY